MTAQAKRKFINVLLMVTSLFGYLEWGGGNSSFLWQAELELFSRFFSDPIAAAHRFTLLPLLGQVLLLITLFQREPGRLITFLGLAFLMLLLGFMFFIGLLSMHPAILLSTIPFMATAVVCIVELRRARRIRADA